MIAILKNIFIDSFKEGADGIILGALAWIILLDAMNIIKLVISTIYKG